jgi:cobalamin biosynthesis protein CobT
MKTVESTRRFMRTWCRSRHIELVESGLVKVPHAVFEKTSGRKIIYLPLISSVNFDEWCRISYHESAHLAPKNLWHYKVMEALGKEKGQMTHEISNCIIDNLAERVDFKEYRGRARILSYARANFTDKLGEIMEMDTPDPHHILRSSLLKWDMINRESWMINFSAPVAHKSMPHLDAYFKAIDNMDLAMWLDKIECSDNEEENIKILVAIVKKIDDLLPKPPEVQDDKSNQENQKGNGVPEEGEGGEGEFQEGSEADTGGGEGSEAADPSGEEESESSSQAGSSGDDDEAGTSGNGDAAGQDEQSEAEGADSGGGATSGSGSPGEQSNTEPSEGTGHNVQQSQGVEVQYTASQKENLEEYNKDMDRPVDVYANSVDQSSDYLRSDLQYYIPCENQSRIEIPNRMPDSTYKDYRYRNIMRLCSESNLDKQVRRHLQLQVHGRTVHGVKRGKLSGKSLHRLYNGNIHQQPAVFKKQEHGKVKMDTALTLLCDMSGSMGSSPSSTKYNLAAASIIAMAEVLAGLRIKHEILGFTERPGDNVIYILKKFTDKIMSRDLLAKKFSANRIYQDYNTDGEALQYAAERLMRMKETNKVLMIMSDGMPAGRYKGDGAYYLQTVVDDIENNSPIHLCAIGIQSGSVKRFYKNVQVIDDMQDLTPAVLNTLKSNLLTT